MTCGGCAAAVDSALVGLTAVSVSLEHKKAVVSFDPSQVTPDQMVRAVEKAGYEAQVRQ